MDENKKIIHINSGEINSKLFDSIKYLRAKVYGFLLAIKSNDTKYDFHYSNKKMKKEKSKNNKDTIYYLEELYECLNKFNNDKYNINIEDYLSNCLKMLKVPGRYYHREKLNELILKNCINIFNNNLVKSVIQEKKMENDSLFANNCINFFQIEKNKSINDCINEYINKFKRNINLKCKINIQYEKNSNCEKLKKAKISLNCDIFDIFIQINFEKENYSEILIGQKFVYVKYKYKYNWERKIK